MGNVYTTNRESIMEYISNIKNKLTLNVKVLSKITIKSATLKNEVTFIDFSHSGIIPRYDVMNDTLNNKVFICIYIPESEVTFQVRYSTSSSNSTFKFKIPKDKLIEEIKIEEFFVPGENSFELASEGAESFVVNYIEDFLIDIFNENVKSNGWTFKCNSVNIKVQKEFIL